MKYCGIRNSFFFVFFHQKTTVWQRGTGSGTRETATFSNLFVFFAKKDGNLDLVQEILRSEKLIFPFFFPTKNETTGSERRSGHVALRLEHVRPVRGQRAADAQPAHRPPRRLRERQPQLGQGQTGQKGRGRTHSPFGVLFWQRCTGFFFSFTEFSFVCRGRWSASFYRVFTEFLPSFYRVFTEFYIVCG